MRHDPKAVKCLVINLPHRGDRLRQIARECKDIGIEFERFPATEGRDPKAAAIACRCAHIGCVALARARGYEHVLILEDDAVFDPIKFRQFWPHIEATLSQSRWDIFLLGCQVIFDPIFLGDPIIHRATAFTLTHAYLVHTRAYDYFVDRMSATKDPIDTALSGECGRMEILMAWPILARQRSGWSDIDCAYKNWHQDSEGTFCEARRGLARYLAQSLAWFRSY